MNDREPTKPTKVTSRGQTTIPKGIRDELGIEEGDMLYWVVRDGELRAVRADDVTLSL